MASEWYYQSKGQKLGPHTADELRQLARAGDILPADKVWRPGMEKPVAASRLKGLFDTEPSTVAEQLQLPQHDSITDHADGHNSLPPIYERPMVLAALTFCCFPIGLVLLWRSKHYPLTSKLLWIGLFAVILATSSVLMEQKRNAVTSTVRNANALWDNQQKGEAIDQYRQLLRQHWSLLQELDRSKAIRRVVEVDLANGNEVEARTLLDRALDHDIPLTFADAKSQELLQRLRAERQASAQTLSSSKPGRDERHLDNNSPHEGPKTKLSAKAEQQYESLVLRVKPGMTIGQVNSILGPPNETEIVDIGKFNPTKAGVILTIETWNDADPAIVLGFENGALFNGGTPGYDIHKGFISAK